MRNKPISLKHQKEITERLTEMGVFDQQELIHLIESWRFSEFVGKFSMGIAHNVFMGITDDQIESGDFNISEVSKRTNEYTQSVGREFYKKIVEYHKNKNYAQAVVDSPLMMWFSSLDPNSLIGLGDYLIDIFATPYYSREDKEEIIQSVQLDGSDILGKLKGNIEEVSKLIDSVKEHLPADVVDLEMFNSMKSLFNSDGSVSKTGAQEIFAGRHSALIKSVFDIGDDISIPTFVTSKTNVTDSLDVFIEFLVAFYDEDNDFVKMKRDILDTHVNKLAELLKKAVEASESSNSHIKSIMGADIKYAGEFQFASREKALRLIREMTFSNNENSLQESALRKLGAIQHLVNSGSVHGEIAEEMASLFSECFMEVVGIEEQEIVSRDAVVRVSRMFKNKGQEK